jgi:hypothetical protein
MFFQLPPRAAAVFWSCRRSSYEGPADPLSSVSLHFATALRAGSGTESATRLVACIDPTITNLL